VLIVNPPVPKGELKNQTQILPNNSSFSEGYLRTHYFLKILVATLGWRDASSFHISTFINTT